MNHEHENQFSTQNSQLVPRTYKIVITKTVNSLKRHNSLFSVEQNIFWKHKTQ